MVPNDVRGRVMSLLQLNMGLDQLLTFPLAGIGQAISLEVLFPILAASIAVLVLAIVIGQRKTLASAGLAARAGQMPSGPGIGMAQLSPEEAEPPGRLR